MTAFTRPVKVPSPYREQDLKERVQELERLYAGAQAQLASRRSQRFLIVFKVARAIGVAVALIVGGIALVLFLGVWLPARFEPSPSGLHQAQIACMPGWVEYHEKGESRWRDYQFDEHSPQVICTDGQKRWVTTWKGDLHE